jgi:LmbE family N-acetylglucosaminyl deacetylase
MVNIRMHKLSFHEKDAEMNVLCIGSHPDDIEIGCGGAILRLIGELEKVQFTWIVLSGDENRRKEAKKSVDIFLNKKNLKKFEIKNFRESYFPYNGAEIKDYFEELKALSPNIIFTHHRHDAHQDHRLVSELTWNTFRDNLILEYEIPKYDGDLGTPNLYAHLDTSIVQKKINHIIEIFKTQAGKKWFTEETFMSLLKIRGIESNSPSRYAEGFHCYKMEIGRAHV